MCYKLNRNLTREEIASLTRLVGKDNIEIHSAATIFVEDGVAYGVEQWLDNRGIGWEED